MTLLYSTNTVPIDLKFPLRFRLPNIVTILYIVCLNDLYVYHLNQVTGYLHVLEIYVIYRTPVKTYTSGLLTGVICAISRTNLTMAISPLEKV